MRSVGSDLELDLRDNKALSIWIALRYLTARRSAMSYVSRLALLGLVLSVAVLVIVLSVVNGFERELRERVLGVLPQITAQGYGALQPDEIEAFKGGAPYSGVVAVAPYVSGTALLAANGKIQGVNISGIEPDSFAPVTDLVTYTTRKSLASLDEERYGIILGKRLADELGVAVGNQVLVVLPVGAITPAGAVPRQRRFTLVDVFNSQSQADGQTALISLSAAQRLFRTGVNVHGVQGRLEDLFAVEEARDALTSAFGDRRVRIRTWQGTHGNLYQAIAVQKMTMFVLLSFLIAVAAFNLISGLMMIVEQRKHDIAVLRTLGAGTGGVLLLFCMLGLVLAMSGIALGVVAGVLVSLALPQLYESASNAFDLNLMTQYFIAYLPVDVRLEDLVQICLAALFLAILATLYPAWRATRLLPGRVLAHE